MSQTVIYIASLGHSGSTLMELLLSQRNKVVGLGEIFQLVDSRNPVLNSIHERDVHCCCGEPAMACPFWGNAVPMLRDMQQSSNADRYRAVFDLAQEKFGADSILVDSSKTSRGLDIVSQLSGLDLKVIHLVKDVRSWLLSMHDTYKRNATATLSDNLRKEGVGGLKKYIKHQKLYNLWHWYSENRAIENLLREKHIKSTTVSYEELCLFPEKSEIEFESLLGAEFGSIARPAMNRDIENHNILGNRMRFSWAGNEKISYDARWLSRDDWAWPTLMFPRILRYNKELVYSKQYPD